MRSHQSASSAVAVLARKPQLRQIHNNESLCPGVAGPLRCNAREWAGSQIGRMTGHVSRAVVEVGERFASPPGPRTRRDRRSAVIGSVNRAAAASMTTSRRWETPGFRANEDVGASRRRVRESCPGNAFAIASAQYPQLLEADQSRSIRQA